MSRRRFLTYLGTGSAALAVGSAGILGCSEEGSSAATTSNPSGESQAFFKAIEPSAKDAVILAEGFKYDIIRKWEDPVTADRGFGYNNDYVAYFPIDARDGSENSEDGLL